MTNVILCRPDNPAGHAKRQDKKYLTQTPLLFQQHALDVCCSLYRRVIDLLQTMALVCNLIVQVLGLMDGKRCEALFTSQATKLNQLEVANTTECSLQAV